MHKAKRKIECEAHGIIDRDPAYENTYYAGLQVQPLEKWDLGGNNEFFVITAGEFTGIVETLVGAGYIPGEDFVCSPDFKDFYTIVSFHGTKSTLLFTCSDYNDFTRARGSKAGGGLYRVDTENGMAEKLVEGSFRQMEIIGDDIYVVDYVEGQLLRISKNYEVEQRLDLGAANYCGLAYDEQNGCFYVANAGTDLLAKVVLNDDNLLRGSEVIATYSDERDMRERHINDLAVVSGRLMASYFSRTANYKFGAFDGGVSFLEEDGRWEEVISGLWKPHSPRFYNDCVWVLDSMRGELLSSDRKTKYKFNGFVRGLDFKEDLIVVGQSQDMYISDRLSGEDVISVDCGLHLLDAASRASRFILTSQITNIHDVRFI